jgi:crossover junction endodeoxyribonuclease RuvC
VFIIKILCLDQATKTSGYSVFSNKDLITYGILEVNKKEKNAIERTKEMYEKISLLIDEISPDFVVFENVQYQQNQYSFQLLSQMQGLVMAKLFSVNLGFQIIEPSGWKSYCGIKGRKRAEQKINTQIFVKEKYGLDVSEDISDAIGIGFWAVNNIIEG